MKEKENVIDIEQVVKRVLFRNVELSNLVRRLKPRGSPLKRKTHLLKPRGSPLKRKTHLLKPISNPLKRKTPSLKPRSNPLKPKMLHFKSGYLNLKSLKKPVTTAVSLRRKKACRRKQSVVPARYARQAVVLLEVK